MLQRILIIGGGFFAILVVLSAVIYRDEIYRTLQDPGEPYQTYIPPPGADYLTADAWFTYPDFSDESEPAVFFIHSTTYSGGANWNAELDKEFANDPVVNSVIPNFAAPFAEAGALHVPRYRQASLYTFMNNREDGIAAKYFAYRDVERAFMRFLERSGDDRAIILGGLGQGGLHLMRLLELHVNNDEALRSRLVAAYILEFPVPLDLFENGLSQIPPCETAEDVRCVYAFSQVQPQEERRIRLLTERTMIWDEDNDEDEEMHFVSGRGLLCINPLLSARSNQFASARMHRGGVAADGLEEGVTPVPLPMQTGAQCAGGLLLTEQARSNLLRRPNRLAEDYREPPYNLFYEDLRLDTSRRALILDTILQEERRWAPPLEAPERVEEAPVIPIPDRREGP